MSSQSAPPDTLAHALLTLRSLYESYLAPNIPQAIEPIVSNVITITIRLAVTTQPYITQLITLATNLVINVTGLSTGAMDSTALMSTAIMIVTLYISLRVFNYMRQLVWAWFVFAFKVMLVLVGVQVAFYISQNGWENAMSNFGWWFGLLGGFFEEVLDVGKSNGGAAPRGTRGRADALGAGARQGAQYAGNQVPVGGRNRWT